MTREEQIADMAVQFAITETAGQKTGKAASTCNWRAMKRTARGILAKINNTKF